MREERAILRREIEIASGDVEGREDVGTDIRCPWLGTDFLDEIAGDAVIGIGVGKASARRPADVLGRSTVESIQSGLYYGTLGMVRSLAAAVTEKHFAGEPPLIIGTGGFGRLFEEEQLFDAFVPELPLFGLRRAIELAQLETKR